MPDLNPRGVWGHGGPVDHDDTARRFRPLPGGVLLALILASCVPIMLVHYLPQTDFPQHLAMTTIIDGLLHGTGGFDKYYELDLGRTLYLLPYGLVLLLGRVMPLFLALQVLVFVGAVSYPLALVRLLRVLGKPPELALLGLPLVYNSAFFWGFIPFTLSLNLALWGISLLVQPRRTTGDDVTLGLVCGALVLTHVYGLALLLAFAVLRLLFGPRRDWKRILIPLTPALVGAVLWPWPGDEQVYGKTNWPSLYHRVAHLPQEVFGAYQQRMEIPLMALFLLLFLLLVAPRFPRSRATLAALTWQERVLWLMVAINVVAYMLLPLHTPGAHFIHFRHILIATMLLPCLPGVYGLVRGGTSLRVGLVALAVAAGVHAGVQLVRFDREARSFDRLLEAVPPRPMLLSLILEPHGRIMHTQPYLHFAAHIQAIRGGVISTSFARFWNIPVRPRRGLNKPQTPDAFEWQPRTFDYRQFGYFYDFVLVRTRKNQLFKDARRFPFVLIRQAPPWQLYGRDEGLTRRIHDLGLK